VRMEPKQGVGDPDLVEGICSGGSIAEVPAFGAADGTVPNEIVGRVG
jgi:hypothetical protein